MCTYLPSYLPVRCWQQLHVNLHIRQCAVQVLRDALYKKLDCLTGLETLSMGSGTGEGRKSIHSYEGGIDGLDPIWDPDPNEQSFRYSSYLPR